MILLLLLVSAVLASPPSVALVDYAPVAMANSSVTYSSSQAFSEIILLNLQSMASYVAKATAGDPSVRLVVFPEDGLYGPDFPSRKSVSPFLEEIPFPATAAACNNSQAGGPVLQFVSCLAQKHNVYIVLDMGERNGTKQYNCAIAVNPAGVLIARYRKQHLYFEPQFDPGPQTDPKTGIFEIDLGGGETHMVGLCVCFDILFPNVWDRMKQVDFVVAPTWWVNLPPLGVSTGMHEAVARAINRTVLVAGVGLDWLNSGTVAVTGDGHVLAQHYNSGIKPDTTIVKVPFEISGATGGAGSPPPAVPAPPAAKPEVQCVLCEAVVTMIESRLPSNATIQDVENMLNSTICAIMPTSNLHDKCVAFLEEVSTELATTIHAIKGQYPARTACDTLSLCGVITLEASAGSSGVIGSSNACVASYSFGSTVTEGERFGLISFVGPYGPPGDAIYNLSSCALVRCSSEKKFQCASVYTEGGPIPETSVFESLSVTYQPSGLYPRTPMSWITDGNYTVIPQDSGKYVNGTHTLALKSPSTVTSLAYWILIPV